MLLRAKFPCTETPAGNASTTLTATCVEPPGRRSSATAASVPPKSGETSVVRRRYRARRLSHDTILGPLRMAKAVPAGKKECRLAKELGQYRLVVPHPVRCDIETPSGDGVVALDPGVRTFLTFFAETDCGKTARGIFLRALGDSPFRRGLLAQVASQPTTRTPMADRTLVSV